MWETLQVKKRPSKAHVNKPQITTMIFTMMFTLILISQHTTLSPAAPVQNAPNNGYRKIGMRLRGWCVQEVGMMRSSSQDDQFHFWLVLVATHNLVTARRAHFICFV